MKRILTIGVALLSVTWGVAFAKGSAKGKGQGHSSPAAVRADISNLAKARVASVAARANGDSARQAAAARANLVKARAARVKKGGK